MANNPDVRVRVHYRNVLVQVLSEKKPLSDDEHVQHVRKNAQRQWDRPGPLQSEQSRRILGYTFPVHGSSRTQESTSN
jgi:hypothetical protein